MSETLTAMRYGQRRFVWALARRFDSHEAVLIEDLLNAARRDGYQPIDGTASIRWMGRDDMAYEPSEDDPYDRALWDGDAFVAFITVDVEPVAALAARGSGG